MSKVVGLGTLADDISVSNGNANLSKMSLTPGSAPSNPVQGDMYLDSSDNKLKIYNGINWKVISNISGVSITGGTTSTYSYNNIEYTVHTILSQTNLTVTVGGTVDILIVGGGGSGGSDHGGGGGAGQLLWQTFELSPGTYTVTPGAGGASQVGVSTNASRGDGTNSTITSSDGFSLTALKGGGGFSDSVNTTSPNTTAGVQGNGGGSNATGGQYYSSSRDLGDQYSGGLGWGKGGISQVSGGGGAGSGQQGGDPHNNGLGSSTYYIAGNGNDTNNTNGQYAGRGGNGQNNFINQDVTETAAFLWAAQIGTDNNNNLITGLPTNPGNIYVAGGGGGSASAAFNEGLGGYGGGTNGGPSTNPSSNASYGSGSGGVYGYNGSSYSIASGTGGDGLIVLRYES